MGIRRRPIMPPDTRLFTARGQRQSGRWRWWTVQLTVLLAVFSVGIAWGLMTNSQIASAELSAATAEDFALHLCEPGGDAPLSTPLLPEDWCGSEDAGTNSPVSGEPGTDPAWRDELIFEDVGPLGPGSEVLWDVRLVNVGDSLAWDLFPFDTSIVEVDDPGEDCDVVPAFDPNDGVTILGINDGAIGFPDGNTSAVTVDDPNQDGATFAYMPHNDNHGSGVDDAPSGAETLFTFNHTRFSDTIAVHVEPHHYEDLRLRLHLPLDAGNECLDTRWALAMQFNVATHP